MIDWREVDGQLRSLAVRRAALDAEEARLLREAERLQIWLPLGMVSALDYMERVLGYAPHSAMERLRVARALEALPVLEAALEEGRLHYSAVRELTRVATPSTEAKWCERAIGKNVRQIEELVAGHAVGDDPDDPADPAVQRHKVTLDLSAEVFARWRQTQTLVADERGGRADDDAFATELLEARLEQGTGEPTGRAKFQIMMTLCRQCDRGWQEGSGVQVLVDAATVERARCDAQYVGSTDDKLPMRASQDIPPSIVRFVWRRDGGKCTTPGCRSARCLEIHHKRPRAEGGTHDPDNLCLKCWACHSAIHRGTLEVVDGEVRRPNAPSHVGSVSREIAATPDVLATADREAHRPLVPSHVGSVSLEIANTPTRGRDADAAMSHVGSPAAPSTHERKTDAAMSHVGSVAMAPVGSPAEPSTHERDTDAAMSHVESPTALPPHERNAEVAMSPIRSSVAPPTRQRDAARLSSFEIATARSQARDALVGLGWKPAIARSAVDDAISHVGPAPIEVVIREALRRCPRPS